MAFIFLFLIAALIGGTIHKDFKYDMHMVLFSYPFSKGPYLIGKFVAGYIITLSVLFSATLGMILEHLYRASILILLHPFQLILTYNLFGFISFQILSFLELFHLP